MRMLSRHILRRSAAELLATGAGTITLDHAVKRPKMKTQRDALAGDWQTIGNDLRWAMRQVADTRERA